MQEIWIICVLLACCLAISAALPTGVMLFGIPAGSTTAPALKYRSKLRFNKFKVVQLWFKPGIRRKDHVFELASDPDTFGLAFGCIGCQCTGAIFSRVQNGRNATATRFDGCSFRESNGATRRNPLHWQQIYPLMLPTQQRVLHQWPVILLCVFLKIYA